MSRVGVGGDNPFADPQDVNPFADPSVQQIQQEQPKEEEFNPFLEQEKSPPVEDPVPKLPPPPTAHEIKGQNLLEKKKKAKSAEKTKPVEKTKPAEKPPGPSRPPEYQPPEYQPAVIQPTPSAPPPFNAREAAELQRREKELAARERAVRELERSRDPRPNNFPPLPAFCPVKPCFYHNIADEVPEAQRWIMRGLLILWAVYCVALLVNSVLLLLGLFVWKTSSGVNIQFFGTSFAISVIYLACYPVLSLVCWYMPIYRGFRKDSSLSFMWFFLMFGLQIFSWVLNSIGFINLGASGLWLGATAIQESTMNPVTQNGAPVFGQFIGALMLIFTLVWIGMAVFGIILFIMVHRYYRRSGYTLEQAQTEALTAAASNRTVRSAAKQAVVTGVRAASGAGD